MKSGVLKSIVGLRDINGFFEKYVYDLVAVPTSMTSTGTDGN